MAQLRCFRNTNIIHLDSLPPWGHALATGVHSKGNGGGDHALFMDVCKDGNSKGGPALVTDVRRNDNGNGDVWVGSAPALGKEMS